MNAWMYDEWTDGRTDEQTHASMLGCLGASVRVCLLACADGWMDELMDGRMDG